MKERTGFVIERDGRLYVRVCYTDSLGKKRELMRRAKDRGDAEELRKKLIKQLDAKDSDKELEAERTTFEKVASQYRDELEKLRGDFPAPDSLVFGITDNSISTARTASSA